MKIEEGMILVPNMTELERLRIENEELKRQIEDFNIPKKRHPNQKWYRVTLKGDRWNDDTTICISSFLGHPPTWKDFHTFDGLFAFCHFHTGIISCEEVQWKDMTEYEQSQTHRTYF